MEKHKEAKVILFDNYKGGVGKTTSVLNFALLYEIIAKKVLLIDLDPQCSLSEILLRKSKGLSLNQIPDESTLNFYLDAEMFILKENPLLRDEVDYKNLIHHYSECIDYIPSSIYYEGKRTLSHIAADMKPELPYFLMLKHLFKKHKKDYDYILVDCPPTDYMVTQAAFCSADYYIIPTILDVVSTNGVIHFIQTVDDMWERMRKNWEFKICFERKPRLLGVFFTLIYGPTSYLEEQKNFKNGIASAESEHKEKIYLFENTVKRKVDIARENGNDRANIISEEQYRKLFAEVQTRIGEMEDNDV